MNYGYGKSFHLKDGFTALNGCVQYYKLTFGKGVDLSYAAADESDAEIAKEAASQANYLRVLEVLRTYGGQPIITKAKENVLEFTLEQANVYGFNMPQQVSAKGDLIDKAKDKIVELFANVQRTDAKKEDADKTFGLTKANVEIKEVLF